MRKMKAQNSKKSAAAEMIEGLREFRDSLRNGEQIEKRFTVRTAVLDPKPLLPSEYRPEAVRATRVKLGVSQAIFAQLLGISVKLVQSWEQGTRTPEMLARHVLDDINRNPENWIKRLARAGKSAARPRRQRVHA